MYRLEVVANAVARPVLVWSSISTVCGKLGIPAGGGTAWRVVSRHIAVVVVALMGYTALVIAPICHLEKDTHGHATNQRSSRTSVSGADILLDIIRVGLNGPQELSQGTLSWQRL